LVTIAQKNKMGIIIPHRLIKIKKISE